MNGYDSMDFQPNSGGVMVVRVIRLKDIVKALSCTEDFAQGVVREIRGETNPDGSLAFVLPSQLAAWAYKHAGKAVAPFPSTSVLVKDTASRRDALKRAASNGDEGRPDTPTSGSTSLKEIRSDLRRMKSATIQPGAVAITVEQAAARLGCSRRRVFELLASGGLKRATKVGRHAMVSVDSVDRALMPSVKVRKRQVSSPAGFELEDIPI